MDDDKLDDWENIGGVLVAPWARADLVAALKSGQPILGVFRNSNTDGTKAREMAAIDADELAAGLVKEGIDIRGVMPTRERIMRTLAESEDFVDDLEEGNPDAPYRTVFAFIDVMRETGAPLILLGTTGSGHKLNEHLEVPVIQRLAKVVREHAPCLTYASELDRLGRDGLDLATVLKVLRHHAEHGRLALFGDAIEGFRELTPTGMANAMTEANIARKGAIRLATNSAGTIATFTSKRMEGGQARYHVGFPLPPGFARARLVTENPSARDERLARRAAGERAGRVGKDVLIYLETDKARPTKGVNDQLPQVFEVDEHGNTRHVDQVENIRWFLKHVFTPGWTMRALTREMVRRKFSTDFLRRLQGQDVVFGHDGKLDQQHPLVSILRNLDVYETGKLTRPIGRKSRQRTYITIENCFPPDGKGWATETDFIRIRGALAEARLRADARSRYTFNRLPCTVGGFPAKLVMRPTQPLTGIGSSLVYGLQPIGKLEKDDRWPGHLYIRHDWLAASLVDALAELADATVQLMSTDPALDVKGVGLRDAVAQHDSAIARKRKRLKVITALMEMTDEEGTLSCSPADVKAYSTERGELNTDIDKLTQKRKNAEDALAGHLAAWKQAQHGARLEQLLRMVLLLRDPNATQFSVDWQRAVRDLTFTWEVVEVRRHAGYRLSWTGTVVLTDKDGRSVSSPLRGTQLLGAASTFEARGEALEADLRRGVITRHLTTERTLEVTAHLVKKFGSKTVKTVANTGDDLLLRMNMLAAFPEADAPSLEERAAACLADPDLVATRDAIVRRTADPLTLCVRSLTKRCAGARGCPAATRDDIVTSCG